MLIHINKNPQPAVLLLKKCCTKLFAWHFRNLKFEVVCVFFILFSFLKKIRFREIFPFSSKVSPSFLAHLFSPAWRSLEALTAQRRYYKIQSRKRYYAGKPGDFFWAVECRFIWIDHSECRQTKTGGECGEEIWCSAWMICCRVVYGVLEQVLLRNKASWTMTWSHTGKIYSLEKNRKDISSFKDGCSISDVSSLEAET